MPAQINLPITGRRDGYFIGCKKRGLFCQLYRDNIKPKHTSVESFNSNWGNDGIPTYGWYHVNFYFLCKDMWNCAGETLIPDYIKAFPKTASQKLSPEEIVKKFDVCTGILNNFEAKLNSYN